VGNNNHAAGLAANITVYGVMAALPVADLLDLGVGRALGQDLVVYAETIAVDTGLQNAVNFIVARPRPLTYAGEPSSVTSGEGYLSFYAGHVSTAFATLSMAAFTIRKRYGEKIWPWVVVGLVGASVAVERVASGDHFPTDVATGALAGTAIGITVPWLHLRREPARLSLTAIGGRGLGIAGTF
jgi:membrane-associated phospholipid phosphatase